MPTNNKSSNTVAPAVVAWEQMARVRFPERRCDFTLCRLKSLSNWYEGLFIAMYVYMYPERPLDLSTASHSGRTMSGLSKVYTMVAPWLCKDFNAPYVLTLYGVYKQYLRFYIFKMNTL